MRDPHHTYSYVMKGGEKGRTSSRHPDIVDISGIVYVPPQGVAMDDNYISSKIHEFRQKKEAEERREREARQAEARAKQAQEIKARKPGAGGGYGSEEDEFSDDERRRAKIKLRYGVEIGLVVPYKPTKEEIRSWEDI